VPGIGWHKARMRLLWEGTEDLGIEPDAQAAYPRYPLMEDEEDVLPTRLGNILLAAERYSASRYSMDPIYFWPRLYPLLPDQFKRDYEEFVLNYEFPLVVAFESFVTAALGGLIVLAGGGSPMLYVGWLLLGCTISYGFYNLSLTSAEELGEQQRTAFDLYRHLLLEQWPTPSDVRDEAAAFSEIQNFIVANMPPSWGKAQMAHHRRHQRGDK
jgi:hypothetical protein